MTLQELLDKIAEVHIDTGKSAADLQVEFYNADNGRMLVFEDVYYEEGILNIDVRQTGGPF